MRPSGTLVLLYHDVFRDGAANYGALGESAVRYHVPLSMFRQHLDIIASSGLAVVSLRELAATLAQPPHEEEPPPQVVICFDDGWNGVFEHALPELSMRGLPATAFVTTGFIGKKFFAAQSSLVSAAGAIDIESHGVSHRMLTSLSHGDIENELLRSRNDLQSTLGRSVVGFSAPGGACDHRVVSTARALGYDYVCTSDIGINPLRERQWGIGRIGVTRLTTDAELTRWLSGDVRKEAWRKALLSIPKRLLGMRRYSHLRRTLFRERGDPEQHVFIP